MTALRMTELDFRRQLVGEDPPGLAVRFGWEHVGFRAARTVDGEWRTPVTGTLGKGWPDVTLVRERDRRLIFAELKSDTGRLTGDQERVLEVLRSLEWTAHEFLVLGGRGPVLRVGARVEVHVWRPRDFDAIAEILR
jgi:hypothetical protein